MYNNGVIFNCATSLIAVLGLWLIATLSYALDVDPGDYTALEPGTKLGLLYLQHAERNELYADGSKVSSRAGLDSDVGILRGVSYQTVANTLTNIQLLLPFGHLEGQGEAKALGSNSGVGDPILAGAFWLYNDPSRGRSLAITQYLYLPFGEYDHNDPLNLGENRWKYVFQTGYIHDLARNWFLDVTGDVAVFGENDEYGPAKQTLKQDLQYQLQTYLRYKATDKLEFHVGASRTWGGETELDGHKQVDQPDQAKLMLGTSYFIEPKTQLLVTYGQDVDVENGFKESNRVNFRLLHVF